ncbi:restriction endonuclease subunit S [Accumulibacter sp.]|uniref:restriction endonuclease subunit S n=1 Tax=Accumulibacter sp. TaxID=2053492 RepID=UPI0025805B30|nr:restriction endonuclease subunit S [Accumulibacter sp.]
MPTALPPEGWQWSSLTEIARLESGHTPSRKYREYWGGNIPWIGIQDARANDGKCIQYTQETTNELGIENSSARVLPENTVCLSRTASVGYVVVMGRPMATSQDFLNWVCSSHLAPDFLKYLFMAEGEGLLRFASGAVHQTIYFPEAKAFHICHPRLPEQHRIVAILDKAFDGIATAKANAENNLRNARALFESHLQVVFTDAWEAGQLVRLADLATDITDGDHMPPPKVASGVPFITIGNIAKDYRTINFSDTFMVPREYFDSLKPNKKPRAGDVLYTVTGSFGIPVLVKERREFCFQRHIGLIRPKSDLHSEWLYYLLMSPQVVRQAHDGATGTAQKTVSLKVLRGFKVPRIPLANQEVAVAKLNTLATATQRLESIYQQKLIAFDDLKKSLLHKALSGKL